MKKLLAIALIVLFTGAVLAPSVFAECSGHKQGTKTADEPAPKTTRT